MELEAVHVEQNGTRFLAELEGKKLIDAVHHSLPHQTLTRGTLSLYGNTRPN
jgi:hypothetical protein